MQYKEPETRVRIHITLTAEGRRALRLAAAARGTTAGALVERWALAEARTIALTVEVSDAR